MIREPGTNGYHISLKIQCLEKISQIHLESYGEIRYNRGYGFYPRQNGEKQNKAHRVRIGALRRTAE